MSGRIGTVSHADKELRRATLCRLKLAEGLVLRADLKRRIEKLRERLKGSALVQDGEAPPEDPQTLLTELERMLAELTALIERINRTNLAATLPDGQTLTSALARRDTLSLHFSVLESTAHAATPRWERAIHTEIKKLATVRVSDLRGQIDELARQRRELDTQIQAANWTTDLIE